jgi:hypothetical protein
MKMKSLVDKSKVEERNFKKWTYFLFIFYGTRVLNSGPHAC